MRLRQFEWRSLGAFVAAGFSLRLLGRKLFQNLHFSIIVILWEAIVILSEAERSEESSFSITNILHYPQGDRKSPRLAVNHPYVRI